MKAIAMPLLVLAACAPTDPMAGDRAMPEPTAAANPQCDVARAQGLVGRTADTATQEEARRLTGARTLRVVPPGAMVTMDFRPDRLNVKTDAGGRIVSFTCG